MGKENVPGVFSNSVAGRHRCRKKGAAHVLVPISARKQLNDFRDNLLIKVTLFYYSDPRDALIKGLAE